MVKKYWEIDTREEWRKQKRRQNQLEARDSVMWETYYEEIDSRTIATMEGLNIIR